MTEDQEQLAMLYRELSTERGMLAMRVVRLEKALEHICRRYLTYEEVIELANAALKSEST